MAELAEEFGFDLGETARGHARFVHRQTGSVVFGSGTPSDCRAWKNIRAKPSGRVSRLRVRFYQYGWHFHLEKQLGPVIRNGREVMFTTASVGTKKGQIAFTDAVNDVVRQRRRREQWRTAFWPCKTDPCLQVADYCTWAIQRKWESPKRDDVRSYNLIKDRITKEYDLWGHGQVLYY